MVYYITKMESSFKEKINSDTIQLKTPHFIIDHEMKHVEKPFSSVASYIEYVGKYRSRNSSLITLLLTNRYMYRTTFSQCYYCYT